MQTDVISWSAFGWQAGAEGIDFMTIFIDLLNSIFRNGFAFNGCPVSLAR